MNNIPNCILHLLIFLAAACTKTGNPARPSSGGDKPGKEYSVENSSLFEKHTDAQSGVVSYILKPNTLGRENSQSNYFNSKSMTDDGRFILFWYSFNEYKHELTDRHAAIIDLKTAKIWTLPFTSYDSIPYLDTQNDVVYYIYNKKTSAAFYKRNLLDNPGTDVYVCKFPIEIYNGKRINYPCTHLTLTQDRKRAFVDARVDTDEFVLGMVDLTDGSFELWLKPEEYLYHAQICPGRDDLVLCAMSGYTDKQGNFVEMENEADGTYPRMQLVRKGSKETIRSQVTNYATHEIWDATGEGICFCSSGVRYHSLQSGEEILLCPKKGIHAFLSVDRNYVVCDCQEYGYYRGCPWSVWFWNRLSAKGVYIHTKTGAVAPDKDHPSVLHPDAHPQFVCGDKYIISTMGDSAGNMRLCVTPVAQLIEMTK